jgi:hypothetical protein
MFDHKLGMAAQPLGRLRQEVLKFESSLATQGELVSKKKKV